MKHPKEEKTFVLIKPDAIERGLVGMIISRLEASYLRLQHVIQRHKRESWAKEYEACVKLEYDKTPVQWFSEHGYYPHCNKFN